MMLDIKALVSDLITAALEKAKESHVHLGWVPNPEFSRFMWEIIADLDSRGHSPAMFKTPEGVLALAIPTGFTPKDDKLESIV